MSSSQTLNAFDHAIAQHSRWKRKFREQLATGSALPTEISADEAVRWDAGFTAKVRNTLPCSTTAI